MSKKEQEQINPAEYSYRQGETIEMPVETFEMLRGYAYREAEKSPPKPMFLNHKAVIEDGQIVWKEFESDEEYKNQTPLEMRDMESVDKTFVNNLFAGIHMRNIEEGKATHIEVLKEEAKEQQKSKIKKVED